MERDPGLEKKILFELERRGRVFNIPGSLVIPGVSVKQVNWHLQILVDRGLVIAVLNANGHGTAYYTISTQGLEFLTALRKDKPVEKVKAATSSATIEVVKLLAAAIVGAIAAKLSGYLHWP